MTNDETNDQMPTVPEDPEFVEDQDPVNDLRVTYQSASNTAIPIKNAEVAFLVNVHDVENLGEALDKAAVGLLRWGLDAFYVAVTDKDTGDEYVVADNQIIPVNPEVLAEIKARVEAVEAEDGSE